MIRLIETGHEFLGARMARSTRIAKGTGIFGSLRLTARDLKTIRALVPIYGSR